MKKSFLFVPGVGRVVLQELRFSQGGLEMPVLVESTETCTSGLSREVYKWDLLCQVVRGSIGF